MLYRKLFSLLSIVFHFAFYKIRVFGNNSLSFGDGVLLWNSRIITKGGENKIFIGNDVNFRKTEIIINGTNNKVTISNFLKVYEYCRIEIEGDNCEIYIGEKTTIGSARIFCGESNTSIQIGKNCMFSREVVINTSDFHSIIDMKTQKRINIPKNVSIGNKVWVGFGGKINKGAVINESSVVAASAIVSGKTYPSNIILAGIPARIIKENIIWTRDKLPF